MKHTALFILLLFFATYGKAQDWQKTPSGIKLNLDSLSVEIQFYTNSIVRIVKVPANYEFNKKSLLKPGNQEM